MKKYAICFALTAMTLTAHAGYDLAMNGKKVTCYADDNQSIELNAKRTTLKYTVEGESLGAKKITKFHHDEGVLACYTTAEGLLCLNDGGDGDTFSYTGESEAYSVDCK